VSRAPVKKAYLVILILIALILTKRKQPRD